MTIPEQAKPLQVEIAEQIARDASCAQGEFNQRVLSIIPYLTDVCDRAALMGVERAGLPGREREALEVLVRKLDRIHADDRYQSVWAVAQLHVGPYTGPTYTIELDRARAALTALPVQERRGPEGQRVIIEMVHRKLQSLFGTTSKHVAEELVRTVLTSAPPAPALEGWREIIEQCAKIAEADRGVSDCPYSNDKPSDPTWTHTDDDNCPRCGEYGYTSSPKKCLAVAKHRIAAAIRALSAPPELAPVSGELRKIIEDVRTSIYRMSDGSAAEIQKLDRVLALLPRSIVAEAKLQPHNYAPSTLHMGDCAVCGHSQGVAIHSFLAEKRPK